ncbi:hypothetical protein DFJ74DRAFT_616644 [Hyaloraphidium curvatum]|nr:hypothetical protein DFJ74DRAFT_616644 [Hyaloraphidium curvatum]
MAYFFSADATAKRPPFPDDAPFTFSQPPHPNWNPGDAQPFPYADDSETFFESDSTPMSVRYGLLINGVLPRPIALVSSLAPDGKTVNVSPYSFFNALSSDPPTVMFSAINSVRANEGKTVAIEKDSVVNARTHGQFVVNLISEWYMEQANYSCGNFLPSISEADYVGMPMLPSKLVKPPRVAAAAFSMECTLHDIYQLKNDKGIVTTNVVIGRVVGMHVKNAVYDKDKNRILLDKYKPVGRLGGVEYTRVNQVFELPRPYWPDGKPPPKEDGAAEQANAEKL